MTSDNQLRVLALEPYYGGSHRAWLDGLAAHLPVDVDIRGLPPRHWKWRMRGAAITYAQALASELAGSTDDATPPWDVVLATDYLDAAAFRALAPRAIARLPLLVYFHENQLLYPSRQEDERDQHFVLTNITSMLAADGVAFNTAYHRNAFMDALPGFLRHFPDERPDAPALIEQIEAKSRMLYVGCDTSFIPPEAYDDSLRAADAAAGRPPVILWNQRWEHDKNPDALIDALVALKDKGVAFRVILCGESFREVPESLRYAPEALGDRLIHHGYALGRGDYARLLAGADIVVSTALHEFFGTAIVEALAAGCYPILPRRLSYPELLPEAMHAEHLYRDDEALVPALERALAACRPADEAWLDRGPFRAAAARFSWPAVAPNYEAWLANAAST